MPASDYVPDDAKEQIRQLREQVQSLMADRVTPALSEAAGRAQDAATHARAYASDKADVLSGQVRDQPLIAVLVAAGVGYLLGRIAS